MLFQSKKKWMGKELNEINDDRAFFSQKLHISGVVILQKSISKAFQIELKKNMSYTTKTYKLFKMS